MRIRGSKVLRMPIRTNTARPIVEYIAHFGMNLTEVLPALLVGGITSGSIAI